MYRSIKKVNHAATFLLKVIRKCTDNYINYGSKFCENGYSKIGINKGFTLFHPFHFKTQCKNSLSGLHSSSFKLIMPMEEGKELSFSFLLYILIPQPNFIIIMKVYAYYS